VDELAGVNAKTGPSVQRGLFSLRRVKGFGGFEADWFHVMSRTCGGAVFFDEVGNGVSVQLLDRPKISRQAK
jgi:putative transposase